jgi:DNA replication protein DnaC
MTTTSTRPSMSDTPANAAITAAAYDLHLPAEAARLAEIAVRERQSHPVFLAEVLAAEVDERAERRRTRRIAAAKFPRIKRLAEFNVDAVPTISSAQLATLAPAPTSCGLPLRPSRPAPAR